MDNRKRYNKKQSISRPLKKKSVYDNVHLVKRYGSIVRQGTPDTHVEYLNNPAEDNTYRFVFKLDAVTAYEDFTKLYDQYKIRAVSVSFIPIMNITSADKSGYASLIYTTYDFNGNSDTTLTKDQIREYQYCKWSPYGKIHTRYFYPRISETSGTSQSTKVGPQNWISTANPSAPYFGLLVNVSNVPSVPTNQAIYKIEVRYYLSFRNTK